MIPPVRWRYLRRLRALRRQGKLRCTGPAAHLAQEANWDHLLTRLENETWIVYPKPAPDGAATALEYLGRYTHKVAISDHRIQSLEHGTVTYSWRDRDDNNTVKLDRLPVDEFTRRFRAHILPKGLQKIRYYGWLSAARRKTALPAIRAALNAPAPDPEPEQSLPERILQRTGIDITACPHCGQGHLHRTATVIQPERGPP